MRSVARLAALALVLCLTATAAQAAAATVHAKPSTMFEDHLHGTAGNDWHIQLQSDGSGRRLTSLVLYAEHCDTTVLATGLRVAADGTFSAHGTYDHRKGSWSASGVFADADNARGTWSVTDGSCTVADHPFAAHDGHGHFILGNERPYAPRTILGRSWRARHLRGLQASTLAHASRWRTLARAKKAGYVISPKEYRCPGIFHARKHSNYMWGRLLDTAAPQALVFWCDPAGRSRMIAAMYRADAASTPPTFRGLIQWHKHGDGPTWMTHIWLVSDSVSAFATCVPFRALSAAGIASYAAYRPDIPIDQPCPETAGYVPEGQTR
jgi:hypothetical protein